MPSPPTRCPKKDTSLCTKWHFSGCRFRLAALIFFQDQPQRRKACLNDPQCRPGRPGTAERGLIISAAEVQGRSKVQGREQKEDPKTKSRDSSMRVVNMNPSWSPHLPACNPYRVASGMSSSGPCHGLLPRGCQLDDTRLQHAGERVIISLLASQQKAAWAALNRTHVLCVNLMLH